MDELVVPESLAGVDIHRHQAVGEQIITVMVSTVVVVRRHLGRKIDDTELRVGADLSPHAGVAGVTPRVVAVFVGPRNRVEDPLALAAVSVEATNITLHALHGPCRATGQMGGAHNDRVTSDERCGMKPDLAGHGVEVLIHGLLEVDDAVGAKVVIANAGGRVEHDELVAGGHVDDLTDAAVVPIRRPRQDSRRGAAAPRSPSSRRCIQRSSPLSASTVTTERREPAVVKIAQIGKPPPLAVRRAEVRPW